MEKPYWKKVKCIKSASEYYIVGKVYNVTDEGYVINNCGSELAKLDYTSTFSGENYSKNSDFEEYIEDPNIFPAGSYVVLLASCDGGNYWAESMPINHCYKLRTESATNRFLPELDIKGNIDNGWGIKSPPSSLLKLKLRVATPEEIAEYDRLGIPFDVTKMPDTLLEEAAKRYPIGTEYRALDPYCRTYSTISTSTRKPRIIYYDNKILINVGEAYVYANGKWAKVITPSKTYKYKEGDTVTYSRYPDKKFIVRGFCEDINKYLISCEGFDGHEGKVGKFTWGGPVEGDINWWATEGLLSPYKEKEKEFELGKWYEAKDVKGLYIKPLSVDSDKNVTFNVIWSNGEYSEKEIDEDKVGDWNLLTDLSEIQQFLPNGHPDKVKKSLVGRYLKALRDNPNHTSYKKGDYILIDRDNLGGSVWCKKGCIFGKNSYSWERWGVELMSEGFVPSSAKKEESPLEICKKKYKAGMTIVSTGGAKITLTQEDVDGICNGKGSRTKKDVYTARGKFGLYDTDRNKYAVIISEPVVVNKLGIESYTIEVTPYITLDDIKPDYWVKIIDDPGKRPEHWNQLGKMNYLYGTWQQVDIINKKIDFPLYIKDGWWLKLSDIVEVSQYPPFITKGEVIESGTITMPLSSVSPKLKEYPAIPVDCFSKTNLLPTRKFRISKINY